MAFLALLFVPWMPWRRHGRVLAALWLGVATLMVFYSFYSMTPLVWWYLRFILPAFPLLIVLAATGWEGWAAQKSRWHVPISAALVFLGSALVSRHWMSARHVLLLQSDLKPYAQAGEWANDNLPRRAAILCMQVSSTLYYYTDAAMIRWDLIDAERATGVMTAFESSGRPLYAILYPFQRDAALKERFRGSWTHLVTFRDLEIWQFENAAATPGN